MLTGANVDARYTSLPISAAMISIVMCICGIEWGLERELEGETKTKAVPFDFIVWIMEMVRPRLLWGS